MYDMYPWNDPDSGANHQDEPGAAWLPAPRDGRRPAAEPSPAAEPREIPADRADRADRADPADRADRAESAGSAIRAVQVALDRRDNGGDALAMAGQPATRPTAGRTRQ